MIRATYLGGSLEVLDAVSVDIVVRSDRLPQLGRDDHARSVGGRSTGEEHDPSASVGERGLRMSILPRVCPKCSPRGGRRRRQGRHRYISKVACPAPPATGPAATPPGCWSTGTRTPAPASGTCSRQERALAGQVVAQRGWTGSSRACRQSAWVGIPSIRGRRMTSGSRHRTARGPSPVVSPPQQAHYR